MPRCRGVYSSTLLYWLGDDSHGNQSSWEFLDRRIEDVMQIETLKSNARKNPVLNPVLRGVELALSGLKPPGSMRGPNFPGALWPRPKGGGSQPPTQ